MTTIIEITSNNTIDALLVHYPADNNERIKELFMSDAVNVQLAIEILKSKYKNLEIIDGRTLDFNNWTNRGFYVKDPTRTATLKPSIL